MENASKVLLIAGGILLAMILLAMLLLLRGNLQGVRKAEVEKSYKEQLTAFNKSFEAYDKKIMYGTDVISVINKAVDINKQAQLLNGEDTNKNVIGFVNIKINVITDFRTTAERYNKSVNPIEREDVTIFHETNNHELENIVEASTNSINGDPIKIGTNELGVWKDGETLILNEDFVNKFTASACDFEKINYHHLDGNYYDYYVYSALTNFKRAVFTCSSVEYNNVNGRIKELTFTQVQEKR